MHEYGFAERSAVSRVERNIEKLGDLYWEGYEEGMAAIPRLREYLNR